jgi:serine/threonine protein kinase
MSNRGGRRVESWASGSSLVELCGHDACFSQRAAMNLRPGMRIGDSVRLDHHLSDGGLASLWAAERLHDGKKVAVKFLASRLLDAPKVADRFRLEAEIASRLHSPHVVRVYELIDAEPGPCLVMELLEGEDLAARLERRGPLTPADTVEIIEQAADALESAHAAGIIHRDVKPENIFLTEESGRLNVKLLDFGVARFDSAADCLRLTGPGVVVGTPPYMSPQQLLDSGSVDARCDVWSLAVAAYTCLTGRPPVVASSFASVCAALQRCEFDPPSQRRPGLPTSVDSFFARALSLRIEERPPSALALSSELRSALHDATGEFVLPLVTPKAQTEEPFQGFPRRIGARPIREDATSFEDIEFLPPARALEVLAVALKLRAPAATGGRAQPAVRR